MPTSTRMSTSDDVGIDVDVGVVADIDVDVGVEVDIEVGAGIVVDVDVGSFSTLIS